MVFGIELALCVLYILVCRYLFEFFILFFLFDEKLSISGHNLIMRNSNTNLYAVWFMVLAFFFLLFSLFNENFKPK